MGRRRALSRTKSSWLSDLHVLRRDACHGRQPGPVFQPACKFVELGGLAASEYFNVPVAQIDGVTRNPKRLGNASCALTEKHALHTSFDRESAGTAHALKTSCPLPARLR